jgi:hypothetical protein
MSDEYPVRLICRATGWPRSSAYHHAAPAADEARLRQALGRLAARWPTYGYRRLTVMLRREGWTVNGKRVRRLMVEMGLKGKAPARRRRTTDSRHDFPRYPNLVESLTVTHPDHVWVAEIVHSQMTKPAGLAGRPYRERIADLDVVPGHHDPVDQQLDQLPLPLERRRVETRPHPLGERSRRAREPAQLGLPAHFAREQPLLGRQRLVAALQLRSPASILDQCDHPAQVGLGQPLDLLGQARSPSPKVVTAGLKFLGQPAPAGRPTQRLGHPIRVL